MKEYAVSLPKIVTPEYYVQLKSLKEPVKYRPYLVKEEKVFLTAKESGDPKDIERAVRQILRECTFGAVDIEKLPSFDIEYLFLQLRSKSVNNVSHLQYECRNVIRGENERDAPNDDGRCHATVPVDVPLDGVQLIVPEGHTNLIPITETITLEMQYPTLELLEDVLTSDTESLANITRVVAQCIRSVCEADGTVHEMRDSTAEERIQFVESLTMTQLEKIQTFFSTMPSLMYETTFQCGKCGYSETLRFKGLMDFFG